MIRLRRHHQLVQQYRVLLLKKPAATRSLFLLSSSQRQTSSSLKKKKESLSLMRTTSSDQVKLVFFGLLRTVSALAATEARGLSTFASAAATTIHPTDLSETETTLPPLELRLAKRTDVPSIQRCNLETLPENYNQQFYASHLREWPDLAFVAVDVSSPSSTGTKRKVGGWESRGSPFSDGFPKMMSPHQQQPVEQYEGEKVVAYVLGKVEERTVLLPQEDVLEMDRQDHFGVPHSTHDDNGNHYRRSQYHPQHVYTTERLGHVTSLAVLEDYRRRGLANELMKQLHYHLSVSYHVDYVGLHVRQSNHAAERLYHHFGYNVEACIPEYYQDGEDAYFMKKRLQQPRSLSSSETGSAGKSQLGGGLFGTLRRMNRPPWVTGPQSLRLPRDVGIPGISDDNNNNEDQREEEIPELLTGTM